MAPNDKSCHMFQAIVARFQRDGSIPICLLTSQVGGLGLTLTAADRVILVDPSWNPAADNQSVDRAYRIGQTRHALGTRMWPHLQCDLSGIIRFTHMTVPCRSDPR
jgi:Helicase conserved C-terminal domain